MITILIYPLVGIIGLVSIAISKIKCTELVEAVVIRLEKKRRGSYLVFSYSYGGESFEVRVSFSSYLCRFELGEKVELYVDPDKPTKFYCPKETIHNIIFFIIFVAGGVMPFVKFKFLG